MASIATLVRVGCAATVRTMSPTTSNSRPSRIVPAKLLAEAAVGAGLMMAEPGGGHTGADQHADDDDGDPDGVDDLPDPLDRMVVVHGAPLSVVVLPCWACL
jgi:hypothetical protein